jgi:DNA-binding NarL/FixJ family response regulator
MEKTKIILVDDHHLVRVGIANLLEGEPDLEIVGQAGNGKELFDLLDNEEADIVILDISLPGTSGIDLSKMILKQYPRIKTMMLSMFTGEEFIFNAINSGAKGYLPKNTSKQELTEAIRTIAAGGEFFAESISNVILDSYIKNAQFEGQQKENSLSKRELEVLKLVAAGMSNQAVADKLFISIRTVESHKNHIMQRLEIKSSVDLIKFAIKNHLVNI